MQADDAGKTGETRNRSGIWKGDFIRNMERTILPLDERLKMAAKSQATSPEAAARLVQRLYGISTAYLFCGSANCDIMEGLTGEFWECLESDLLHYGGFCHIWHRPGGMGTGGDR